MIAIVSVIDHLFGKRSIEAIPDIDVGLTTTLKQVTPRLEDISLMRLLPVKPVGDANGEMVAIKSTPNWRVHGEKPATGFEVLQHSLECKREPIDVLKASDGEDQIILIMVVAAEIFSITVEVTVSLAYLEEPLLFRKVSMKLIGLAKLLVIGWRFNSSPAVATKMVDH